MHCIPSGHGLVSHRLFSMGHLPPKQPEASSEKTELKKKKKTLSCDVCTVTLASGGSLVPRRDKAEAGRAVSGHGRLVQGDQLVAELQRTVQTLAQLLNDPHDANAGHVLDHGCRGVQFSENNLRKIGE